MSKIEEIDLCIVCNTPPGIVGDKYDYKKRCIVRTSRRQKQKKLGVDTTNDSELDDAQTDLILLPHLRVIFLMKQIFKTREHDESNPLEIAMQTLGDPGKWCQICNSCSALVDRGIDLLRKIRRCEEDHKGVVDELEKKFAASRFGAQQIPESIPLVENEEETKNRLDFRTKIREDSLLSQIIKEEPGDDSECFDARLDSPLWNSDHEETIEKLEGGDGKEEVVNPREFKELFTDPTYKPCMKLNAIKSGQGWKKLLIKKVNDIKRRRIKRKLQETTVPRKKRPYKKKSKSDSLNNDGAEDPDNEQLRMEKEARETQRKKILEKRIESKLAKQKFYENCSQYLDMTLFVYPPITKKDVAKISRNGTCSLQEEGQVKKGNFPCPVCPKFFANKYFAIAHIHRVHYGIKRPWKCNQCRQTNGCTKRFRKHLTRHEVEGLKTCPVCGYFAASQMKFDQHLIDHQKEVATPSCGECNKTFLDFKLYVNHMTNTHGFLYSKKKTVRTCDLCSYTTASRNIVLDFHKFVKHNVGSNDGKFPMCTDCGQIFPNNFGLNQHVASHHAVDKVVYCCEYCGKEYNGQGDLNAHVQQVHVNTPEECRLCGISLQNASKLRYHMTKHHRETYGMSIEELDEYARKKQNEKTFQCSQCSEAFPYTILLYHHYRSSHPEITDKFKCDVCGKGFSRQCSVKRHYEAAHMKLTRSCDLCGKECSTADGVYQHKRSHCPVKKQQEQGSAVLVEETLTARNHDGNHILAEMEVAVQQQPNIDADFCLLGLDLR